MPLGAGYMLATGGASGPPPPLPAWLSDPLSITFDGTSLWTCTINGAAGQDGQFLQKLYRDPSIGPYVSDRIDMFDYADGGAGGTQVFMREVRSDGSYAFVCILCGSGGVPGANGFCVIVDKVTNAIVGHVQLPGSGNRKADGRSVTFDGAGNFFVAQTPGSTSATDGTHVRKYSISGVIAAYPSFGTQTSSRTLTHNGIEEMDYGSGGVWIAHGQKMGDGGYLTRVDATTMVETVYTFAGPIAGWQGWAVKYAFGSVWVGASSGIAVSAPLLKFDPATFTAGPTAQMTTPTNMHVSGGMGIGADSTRLWFGGYQSGGNIWVIDPAGPSIVATVTAAGRPVDFAFDGANMFAADRNGRLLQMSTGPTPTLDKILVDGGP